MSEAEPTVICLSCGEVADVESVADTCPHCRADEAHLEVEVEGEKLSLRQWRNRVFNAKTSSSGSSMEHWYQRSSKESAVVGNLKDRARWYVWASIAVISLVLVQSVLLYASFSTLNSLVSDPSTIAQEVKQHLSFVGTLLMSLAVVLLLAIVLRVMFFCTWAYSAIQLLSFRGRQIGTSPMRVVVSFFIPIVNIFALFVYLERILVCAARMSAREARITPVLTFLIILMAIATSAFSVVSERTYDLEPEAYLNLVYRQVERNDAQRRHFKKWGADDPSIRSASESSISYLESYADRALHYGFLLLGLELLSSLGFILYVKDVTNLLSNPAIDPAPPLKAEQ